MDCKPQNFGGSEGAVGLLRWFEKLESCFAMCNCPPADRVKYATATLENLALSWWNSQVQILGVDVDNATPWVDFKELMKRSIVLEMRFKSWRLNTSDGKCSPERH